MITYFLNIKNTYKAESFNMIIKKSKLKITDMIKQLKNEKYVKLLLSFYQHGSYSVHGNMYIIDPETNDIFIGIHIHDISDNILLNFNNRSDAYIFLLE